MYIGEEIYSPIGFLEWLASNGGVGEFFLLLLFFGCLYTFFFLMNKETCIDRKKQQAAQKYIGSTSCILHVYFVAPAFYWFIYKKNNDFVLFKG